MGDILLGEEALADGLVDEIGTMSDVLERDFPGHKLKKLRRGEIGHGILKFFEPAVMKSFGPRGAANGSGASSPGAGPDGVAGAAAAPAPPLAGATVWSLPQCGQIRSCSGSRSPQWRHGTRNDVS